MAPGVTHLSANWLNTLLLQKIVDSLGDPLISFPGPKLENNMSNKSFQF